MFNALKKVGTNSHKYCNTSQKIFVSGVEKLGSNSIAKLNFNIIRFSFLMIPLCRKDSIQFNKHLMSHYYAKTLLFTVDSKEEF